jgi:hypothetical protein
MLGQSLFDDTKWLFIVLWCAGWRFARIEGMPFSFRTVVVRVDRVTLFAAGSSLSYVEALA